MRIAFFVFTFGLSIAFSADGQEPIKDPAKARQRAQFLMRQFVVEVDGRLTTSGKKQSAKEILDEIVTTCPDTKEANTAKVYLKHIERMDEAINQKVDPKAKPLVLAEIFARQKAQASELATAQRSGNENIALTVKLDHYVERAKWKGQQVVGVAQVNQISGSDVYLFVKSVEVKGKKKTESLRNIWAKVNKDDPLLASLRKGNEVQISGTLEVHGYPLAQVVVKDAAMAQKK